MRDVFRRKQRPLGPWELEMIDRMKSLAEELYEMFGQEINRETALAKTKLEEAIMWAVKGLTGENQSAQQLNEVPCAVGQDKPSHSHHEGLYGKAITKDEFMLPKFTPSEVDRLKRLINGH